MKIGAFGPMTSSDLHESRFIGILGQKTKLLLLAYNTADAGRLELITGFTSDYGYKLYRSKHKYERI